jgi:hypothetical protein
VEEAGIHAGIKVQPPAAVTGHFPKDRFAIDLNGKTVTCPAGVTVPLRASGHKRHAAAARFGAACLTCPLAAQCTTASQGRTITTGPHEARLAAAGSARQTRPGKLTTGPPGPKFSGMPPGTLVWVVEVHADAINWNHSTPAGYGPPAQPGTDYFVVMNARTGQVPDSGECRCWPLSLGQAAMVTAAGAEPDLLGAVSQGYRINS